MKSLFLFAKLPLHSRDFSSARGLLSKQIFLRSGPSISANVEEAIRDQSKADFISKLAIAYKEARETSYWLRLLKDDYLTQKEFESIHPDVEELCRIIDSIKKSTKNNS